MPSKPDSPAVAVLKREIAEWRRKRKGRALRTQGWYQANVVISTLTIVLRDVRAAEKSPWMPSSENGE